MCYLEYKSISFRTSLKLNFFMKILTSSLLLFFMLIGSLQAQSIVIQEISNTEDNSADQYLVAGNEIEIRNGDLVFTSQAVSNAINEVTGLSSSIGIEGVNIYEGPGNLLFNTAYNFTSSDNSLKIYSMMNGGFVVRENIANFLFFNADGDVVQTISNSSQSREGESISELATDPAFKTVVLFNPKIVRNGVDGSRARVVSLDGSTQIVFSSTDREIRNVKISEDGQFISIISFASGTDDRLTITDRYGNELSDITFDQTIMDDNLSEDGEFVALRSNSRVAVFSTITEERIGGTSFSSTLHFAEYISEDETVFAVTGSKAAQKLTDVQFHAINIAKRKIQRQDYNATLGKTDLIPVGLIRESTNNYILTGLSRSLNLRVQF